MLFLVRIEKRVRGKLKVSGQRYAVARPVLEVASWRELKSSTAFSRLFVGLRPFRTTRTVKRRHAEEGHGRY